VVVLTILLCAIFPIIGYLHVFNQELVSLFLGQQWLPFAHLLPLLAVFTITFAVSTFVQQGLIANGDIKLLSVYEMVTLSLLIGLIAFFFSGSMEEFIITRLVFSFMVLSILLVFCSIRFGLPVVSLLFMCTLLATACFASVLSAQMLTGPGILYLLLGSALYFGVYLVACLFFLFVFKRHRILEEVSSLGLRFIRSKRAS